MKKFEKMLLTLVAVFIIAAAIKVPAAAYTDTTDGCTMTQTYAAYNGVTVTWTKPTKYSNRDNITEYYLTLDSHSGQVVGRYGSNVRQAWVNLPSDYTGRVYLNCKYRSGGYTYTYAYYLTYAYVNTIPSTPGTNFGINYISSSNGVEFKVNRPNTDFKSQIWVYQNYTPLGILTFNQYSNYFYSASDTVYRYCARYYYTNPDNGVTYTGNWSGFRAYDIAYWYGQAKSNKKGFKMTVHKGTGVAYYNLYVNDRFVKRLSTGKKWSKTFTIKKGYWKKRYNSIKMYPIISGYGASDTYKSGSLYIWK